MNFFCIERILNSESQFAGHESDCTAFAVYVIFKVGLIFIIKNANKIMITKHSLLVFNDILLYTVSKYTASNGQLDYGR